MWLPVLFGQGLLVVFQRVRRVGLLLCCDNREEERRGCGVFLFFLVPPWSFEHIGDAGFAGFSPLVCRAWGYGDASHWTCPVGRGHCRRNLSGEFWSVQKIARRNFWFWAGAFSPLLENAGLDTGGENSRVWGDGCSGVPSKGRIFFLPLTQLERKVSYHTAWAVPCDSSCTCSYACGHGPAIGPHTGRRCWPLLEGVWRAHRTPYEALVC